MNVEDFSVEELANEIIRKIERLSDIEYDYFTSTQESSYLLNICDDLESLGRDFEEIEDRIYADIKRCGENNV